MFSYLPTETVLKIDLAAIQKNFQYMKSLTGSNVTHAAVVKSDAYGLGLLRVAKALEQAGCRFFFVADLEEGVRLRSACPTVSIAVFRGDLAKYGAVYRRYNLTPVVNTVDEMALAQRPTLALPFILHLDTGLTRLGLSPEEVTRLYLEGSFDRAPLLGLVSHLGCSTQATAAVNELQRHRFEAIYNMLRPRCGSLVASAGVWLGQRYHFDMVRLGSALFGLNDAGIRPNPLRPVIHLSAPIIEVRDVPEREAVGYAATFRTERASRIAVLGIGYRHGLPWSCANSSSVRIGHFTAPVVGRISMEYTTIDVTDIPESACYPGAWVDLLDDRFSVDDMADMTGVLPQEIMLRLGSGSPHQYMSVEPESCSEPRRVNALNYGGIRRPAEWINDAVT